MTVTPDPRSNPSSAHPGDGRCDHHHHLDVGELQHSATLVGVDIATDALDALSPQLYNPDLAPTKRAGRKWRPTTSSPCGPTTSTASATTPSRSVFSLSGWVPGRSCSHSWLASSLLFCLLSLSGFMGEKTGCSVPCDEPYRLRHPRRADPRDRPWRCRHRLVRHPDVPGLGGAPGRLDRDLPVAGIAGHQQHPRACPLSAGFPSSPCGSFRSSSSATAWR